MGSFQFIDRTGGNGRGQLKHHGVVACIDASGTVAEVAGTLRDGDSSRSARRGRSMSFTKALDLAGLR